MQCFFRLGIVLLFVLLTTGCDGINGKKYRTRVSLQGDKWYFNDKLTNQGSPAEGLLMNIRMVNSVFEDRGKEMPKQVTGFDPIANTDEFILKIPEYASSGVNAFTISLQGGHPGYEGAVNTAFNADGSIREEYLQRVEKVIRICNDNHVAVILSCFYQRQHSHFSALTGKESIIKALENTVNWITEKKFTNVLLEVANEYRHGGYRNWPDGEWLVSEAGQIELIRLAKRLNPRLLVSTCGMGETLALEVDFILIHFNNTSFDNFQSQIEKVKKYGKPIVCNEDDKVKQEGAVAVSLSVLNHCGWGYMNSKRNQEVPFDFFGTEDDTAVYRMMKNLATPGYQIDPAALKQTSIIITYPNDGDVFRIGQSVKIKLSFLYPDKSNPYNIEILSNKQVIASIGEKLSYNWKLTESGVFVFEAVVKNGMGKELYRSRKADIIVQAP